jgi:hypothetical protein
MLKVAPFPVHEHDILATPFRDHEIGGPGITVLVVLVAVALALGRALRATLAAAALLLRPTVQLFRTLVFVVGLVVVIGWGLVSGHQAGARTPAPAPATTQPAPEPAGQFARP